MLFAVAFAVLGAAGAQSGAARVAGMVLDPAGRPVGGARVALDCESGARVRSTTGRDGRFTAALTAWGACSAHVQAAGFAELTRAVEWSAGTPEVELRLERVATAAENVIVMADVSNIDIESPDPSQKVMVREELLDANPGRPGAPISIPGLPIETASGGIKAPQYFAPGVAGDHGESIAQYIAVGGYLVPSNLSANAHGNGYSDPNIYVSAALGNVGTDGGAFNVLEGNHSLNLAATYSPRPQLARFLTLTGDFRDVDLTAGIAPSNPAAKQWLALEVNYGNGLMRTLEHRQQYKWNALRQIDAGRQVVTLFSDGYCGQSHEGNLVPIGDGVAVNDTIDPRQRDQTHTSILVANDEWKAGLKDQVAFSGFFRTYNLALFSDFGEGLIRQSEFRTMEGAEARETHSFGPRFEAMAGADYNQDDIHNDNLDHYLGDKAQIYGTFVKVLANNVTIREAAPYWALRGGLGKHVRVYAGLRTDEVEMINTDKMRPAYSFAEWKGMENPKATVTWSPGSGPARWMPSASFSMGQAFFTEDPRISVAPSAIATGAPVLANPFERSHAGQLALEKEFSGTDVRLTLARTTMTATSGKIDPDNGTAFDLGPSTVNLLTASARHGFRFGTVQAVVSKADARLAAFNGAPGTVVPEAPRTIFDVLTALDRLPFGVHARGEYEYVGHKFLDAGNPRHPNQYEAIPVGETRLAMVRGFLNGRLELGADGMVARGYTGQTTETFDPAWSVAASGSQLPYCAPGSGPSGLENDFDCGTVERGVGVRMVSWVGGSVSWRFSMPR